MPRIDLRAALRRRCAPRQSRDLRTALGVLAASLASTPARADSEVTVTLNQDGANLAEQIGASVPQLIESANARIDALFELHQLPRLLRAFANTGAFANHAVGVDYQPDAGDIMFGIVADSAIANDAQLSSDEDRVFSATVVNYGIVAGVNLARWNQPRWTLSVNGSYASTTIRGLAGALLSGGAHAQYKLIRPRARGAFAWTGLDATSGLEYSRWEISLADTLDTSIRVEGSLDHATVGMLSSGTLTVLAKTFAVPLTFTTGVRLADHLGLYIGGGASLVFGSSTVTALLDSRLTINADDLPIGTAMIRASAADGPDTFQPHGLAGVQLHTRHFRAYVQGAMAPDERSVAVGLRAGFQ